MASTRHTYEELAQAAGVRLCPLDECMWKGGDERDTVHFANMRFTYPGAFTFLRFAYKAKNPGAGHYIHGWQQRFRRVRWMTEMAQGAGVRIPRYLWALERAKLREEISRHKRLHGGRGVFDPDREELREAERWAWKDDHPHP